jgi:beta-galactosidase
MAILQSEQTAGSLTIEASSPGLTAARATIACRPVRVRPQVAPWEWTVPAGAGVTGLWRPKAATAAAAADNPMALAGGVVEMVFTLRQDGTSLSGSLEAAGGGGFGGGATGGPIEDGRIDGAAISFRVGAATYAGTVTGEQIELQRSAPPRRGGAGAPAAPADASPRPAVGPPLPGSDPSFGAGRSGQTAAAPLVLRRVTR